MSPACLNFWLPGTDMRVGIGPPAGWSIEYRCQPSSMAAVTWTLKMLPILTCEASFFIDQRMGFRSCAGTQIEATHRANNPNKTNSIRLIVTLLNSLFRIQYYLEARLTTEDCRIFLVLLSCRKAITESLFASIWFFLYLKPKSMLNPSGILPPGIRPRNSFIRSAV